MLPDPIKKLADLLTQLPGIGPRHATRLSFHLAAKGKDTAEEFQKAFNSLATLKQCEACFRHFEGVGNQCDICADPKRDKKIVAIIEKETDLISLERPKKFLGRYLILGELQKDGVLTPEQKKRLAHFKKTIAALPEKKAKEIILAFSPTTYGDLNANIVAQELNGAAEKITRLGRGIPTGGEIEFADEETLGSALKNRG